MHKKIITLVLFALLLAHCFSAAAQQTAGISRIGFLATTSGSIISTRLEVFRQRLRELGYVQ
ncbi:MAG: hypothetical protein ACXWZE_19005, partial [Candidatus Binatia bacterium]